MAMLVVREAEQALTIQVEEEEAPAELDKVQQMHLPQAEMVAQA
jgi:hypothetical protein